MKGKRRRHDPEFKARVALEAIKGVKTIQEIAKEYDIHPVQGKRSTEGH
jgi:transposase/putative transposase